MRAREMTAEERKAAIKALRSSERAGARDGTTFPNELVEPERYEGADRQIPYEGPKERRRR